MEASQVQSSEIVVHEPTRLQKLMKSFGATLYNWKIWYRKRTFTQITFIFGILTTVGLVVSGLGLMFFRPDVDFWNLSFLVGVGGLVASIFGVAVTVHISFQQENQLEKIERATKEVGLVATSTKLIADSIRNNKHRKENTEKLIRKNSVTVTSEGEIAITIVREVVYSTDRGPKRQLTPVEEDFAVQVLQVAMQTLDEKTKVHLQNVTDRDRDFSGLEVQVAFFLSRGNQRVVFGSDIFFPIILADGHYMRIDSSGKGLSKLNKKQTATSILTRTFHEGKTYISLNAETTDGIWVLGSYFADQIGIRSEETKTQFQKLIDSPHDFVLAVSGEVSASHEVTSVTVDGWAFKEDEFWKTFDGGSVAESTLISFTEIKDFWNPE